MNYENEAFLSERLHEIAQFDSRALEMSCNRISS